MGFTLGWEIVLEMLCQGSAEKSKQIHYLVDKLNVTKVFCSNHLHKGMILIIGVCSCIFYLTVAKPSYIQYSN